MVLLVLIKNLNGQDVPWKLNYADTLSDRPRSSFHLKARQILQERFPTHQVLEEVAVPILPRTVLYLDFFLPLRKLAVEVHGQQHYTYNSFFHKTQRDFFQQIKNDKLKCEWCELNHIELLVLSFESEDKWTEVFY